MLRPCVAGQPAWLPLPGLWNDRRNFASPQSTKGMNPVAVAAEAAITTTSIAELDPDATTTRRQPAPPRVEPVPSDP